MTFWPFNSFGITSHHSGRIITIVKWRKPTCFRGNNKTIYHTNRGKVNFWAKVITAFSSMVTTGTHLKFPPLPTAPGRTEEPNLLSLSYVISKAKFALGGYREKNFQNNQGLTLKMFCFHLRAYECTETNWRFSLYVNTALCWKMHPVSKYVLQAYITKSIVHRSIKYPH